MRCGALGLLLVLLLSTAQSGLAQSAPAQEVTLNLLTRGEPDTLDPNRASYAYAVDGAVLRQLFEPLLRFDEKLVPQPAAADSYEVSLDGLTYTFHLRSNGRWSDGQPVTAADFAFSWKRLLDPALHAEYAPLFTNAGIASVTAVDALTFQVQLSQPFGALPDLAALWVAAPLRPDIVGANPDTWATDPSTLIGNGPFMLADWAHQDHLTLVPNPQYVAHLGWPVPTLTRITVEMQTNPEAPYAAYTGGSSPDWTLVPDVDANTVLNDAPLAAEARRYNELTTFWLQMNTAHAPLTNALVRRALAKGIDRAALVRDLATGVSVPTTSVIPAGMPGFQDALGHDLAFDAAGARGLLTQAGFSNANPLPSLTFAYPDTPSDLRRAQYFQDQLSANLGVDLKLNAVDPAAYDQAISAGGYDLAFGGWSADYPDPQDWLRPVFGCQAPYNTYNYCNSGLDQVAARADTEGNLSDRLALYAQAQTQLLQDVPVAPLFNRGRLVLVKPWIEATDGGALKLTPLDDYPGSLFLDEVQILPH